MINFDSLGLSPKALQAVARMGYDMPTPVQEKTIPLVLEGRDVIAGAQTGTGKTAAFCLPCMDQLGHASKNCGPLMLVVTPTRELADQIGHVCNQIANVTKHKVLTVVGGVSYNPQREALKRGTDVLIATPGRLEDLMKQEACGLDQVKIVVIDEADRMLDMGFLPSVQRIVDACTAREQTLLFSATIDDAVQKVAKKMLHDPASVEIARRGETADTVDQYLVRISHAAKPSALKAILKERGAERVIVFARTRHRADACQRRINRMGFKAEAIHSDKSQVQRRRSLEGFAKGKVNVLVATDVLARGIDVSQVDYVVNYDIPSQPEDYVHRIGRTGRAGQRGYAISLVCPENKAELSAIESLIKRQIPEIILEDFDVEAVEADAQVRSLQLQARRTRDPEVAAVVKDLTAKKKKANRAAAKAEAEAGAGKAGTAKAGKGKKGKRSQDGRPEIKPEVLTPEQIAALEEAAREVASKRGSRSGKGEGRKGLKGSGVASPVKGDAAKPKAGAKPKPGAKPKAKAGAKPKASAKPKPGAKPKVKAGSKSQRANADKPYASKAAAAQRDANREVKRDDRRSDRYSDRRDDRRSDKIGQSRGGAKPKGDFRPGRAHRAAIAGRRSRG